MWVKTLCLGETVRKLSSRAVAMITNGVLAVVLIVLVFMGLGMLGMMATA